MRTISSPFAAARTSSEKCALGSLIPTDFMHAPPIGGQPECDHPPEKRSVTTFFHQRPPSRLHVTTFPQSADTDGEAVTTSRLRPARPQAQRCARGAAMWRIRAAVGPAGKKPPQARERTPRITRARTLGASAVRVDAPPSRRSVRLPIAEKLKEPQRTPAPRPWRTTSLATTGRACSASIILRSNSAR